MAANLFVTKPFLPPLEEYLPYLEEIWRSGQITNGGNFHQQLESRLCSILNVPYISLVNNGTIALVLALQTLRISGEVITTPFTFAATAHALKWNGIEPVFVDIDRQTYNIDPRKIEAAITPRTTAILPVHVYGRPCDVEALKEIADRYGLKIIYDAAHAFGVNCDCGRLLSSGDMSALSFHATKVFNTFEGGAIVSNDQETKVRIDRLKNFGYASETQIVAAGINGKLNELQAAMGLLQLEHLDDILTRREEIDTLYRIGLTPNPYLHVPPLPKVRQYNYSYFPIEVRDGSPLDRDALFQALISSGINVRRYFYPLVSNFSPYDALRSSSLDNLPNAHDVASRIVCLPIYPDLAHSDVEMVIEVINKLL